MVYILFRWTKVYMVGRLESHAFHDFFFSKKKKIEIHSHSMCLVFYKIIVYYSTLFFSIWLMRNCEKKKRKKKKKKKKIGFLEF